MIAVAGMLTRAVATVAAVAGMLTRAVARILVVSKVLVLIGCRTCTHFVRPSLVV